MTSFKQVKVAQVPSFDRDFLVQPDVIDYLKKGLASRTYSVPKVVTFFSSDNFGTDNLKHLEEGVHLFGIKEEQVALDFNSSGVALACKLKHTPFVSIKVVGRRMAQVDEMELYLKVLDSYIDLGKGVISTIGDISSNNIVKGGQVNNEL